jgi:hypothetical protein
MKKKEQKKSSRAAQEAEKPGLVPRRHWCNWFGYEAKKLTFPGGPGRKSL